MYANPSAAPLLLFLAWLVPTLAWIASLYGGDYFDRRLDALTKPHRPIPSGRIRAATAKWLMIVYIGIGGVIAAVINPLTVILAALATAFGIGYARWLKGYGLWGNVMRGLPTALALLFGSMTVSPLPPVELVVLALMYWAHDAGSNLLGALCDRDGDRLGGFHTYPVQHGDAATVAALTGFFAAWSVIGLGWPLTVGDRVDPTVYYLGLALCLILGATALRKVAAAASPIPRPIGLRAHEIVVIERILLGSLLVAAAGRPGLAAAVGLPSLVLTVVSRRLMRRRYEPAAHRS